MNKTVHFHLSEVMTKFKELEDKLAAASIVERKLRADNVSLESNIQVARIDAQRACGDKMKLGVGFNLAKKEIEKEKGENLELKKEVEKLKKENSDLKVAKERAYVVQKEVKQEKLETKSEKVPDHDQAWRTK